MSRPFQRLDIVHTVAKCHLDQMCSGEGHFVKAQNRAQPLATYEQLPEFQGQDVAAGKAQASIQPGNLQ